MSSHGCQQVRRVLMTADTIGGVWTYAMELCREFSLRGVQVILATMGAPLCERHIAEVGTLANVEVHSGDYRLEWMQDPWEDVERSGDWLQELAENFGPDIIHLNGYAHGALAWKSPVILVGHSCVLSWWHAVRQEPLPPAWREYETRVRAGLRRADLIVAPTCAMLDSLECHYGPLSNKQVIFNGCNGERFRCAVKKEDVILSAGRVWDPAKNILGLAGIARLLPWPVWVAGDTVGPDGADTAMEDVRLLGRMSGHDLVAAYSRAAIYALPARYEPFGLSVLEAALSRCALVLGETASQRELWEGAAVFVPPEDSEALQTALQDLISNSTFRDRMARLAWERAQSLNSTVMAESYLSAYRGLVGRGSTQPAELVDLPA